MPQLYEIPPLPLTGRQGPSSLDAIISLQLFCKDGADKGLYDQPSLLLFIFTSLGF